MFPHFFSYFSFLYFQGRKKPSDQSLFLGDAEKFRCFLLPSEADAFLRGETLKGYPKLPPFTPFYRCYQGKHVANEIEKQKTDLAGVHKNEDTGDISNDNDISATDLEGMDTKNVIMSHQKCLNNVEDDLCSLTNDTDGEPSFEKNLQNSTKCPNVTPLSNNRQKRNLKFRNPPRHVFNLVVKVIQIPNDTFGQHMASFGHVNGVSS